MLHIHITEISCGTPYIDYFMFKIFVCFYVKQQYILGEMISNYPDVFISGRRQQNSVFVKNSDDKIRVSKIFLEGQTSDADTCGEFNYRYVAAYILVKYVRKKFPTINFSES